MALFRIPHIKLAGVGAHRSSTGSGATALTAIPVQSPGLAQGSGGLQANEAISYGQVPLQYARSPVPNAQNVNKPVSQHTHFVVPTIQRKHKVAQAHTTAFVPKRKWGGRQ